MRRGVASLACQPMPYHTMRHAIPCLIPVPCRVVRAMPCHATAHQMCCPHLEHGLVSFRKEHEQVHHEAQEGGGAVRLHTLREGGEDARRGSSVRWVGRPEQLGGARHSAGGGTFPCAATAAPTWSVPVHPPAPGTVSCAATAAPTTLAAAQTWAAAPAHLQHAGGGQCGVCDLQRHHS